MTKMLILSICISLLVLWALGCGDVAADSFSSIAPTDREPHRPC